MKEDRPGPLQGLLSSIREGQLGRLKEKDVKNLMWIVLLGVIGIYLLVAGGRQNGERMVRPPGQGTVPVSKGMPGDVPAMSGRLSGSPGDIEGRLSTVLSHVRGAGRVEVCIWFEGEGEREFAWNVTEETRTTEEKGDQSPDKSSKETRVSRELVLARGTSGNADSPIVSRILSPRIGGVLVLADGAINPSIRLALTGAVTTVLCIPAHKVLVLPRQK